MTALSWALIVFFTVSAVNLYLQTEYTPQALFAKKISKGFLMPTLCVVLFIGGWQPLLGAALLFSTLGDILLIGKTDKHFLLGLISFLVAHIGYCVYFYTLVDVNRVPIVMWGLVMVIAWYGVILFKGVGPERMLRIGMPIYMLAIGGMIWLAMLNFQQKTDLASSMLLLGALLFGSSDSVLAFRRIRGNKILPESYVMFSYISGQCLIILSQL